MTRKRFIVALISFILSTSYSVFANSVEKTDKGQKTIFTLNKGKWKKGQNTVIKLKSKKTKGRCNEFNVSLTKELSYSIRCHGQKIQQKVALDGNGQYTVTRRGAHITITRYEYLLKKPQTGRLELSSIRIPYVREVIHIKKHLNGELAFYRESFVLDAFGRIVQEDFIQAHSLTSAPVQVSSND